MKVVLALVVVAALVASSEAVKCYNCAACAEPSVELDCGDAITGCTKVDLDGVVTRTCGTSLSDGCNTVKALGIKTTTCQCTGALCNGAGTTTISMVALIAPLLVAKLF